MGHSDVVVYTLTDLISYGDEATEVTDCKILAIVGPATAGGTRLHFELCHGLLLWNPEAWNEA